MKILLTLFVLLFSSSVVAENNVKGKKLYCERIINNLEPTITQLGFDFHDNTIVEVIKSHYYYSNTGSWAKEPTSLTGRYDPGDNYIYVELFPDYSEYYHINRTNLETTWQLDLIYYSGECKVIEVEDLFFFINTKYEDIVSEIIPKNKL